MTQDALKNMTAGDLLAEYRVAAISCDNQFQHARMMKAEAELLRRLQPEGQCAKCSAPKDHAVHVVAQGHEFEPAVAHSSSSPAAEPQPQSAGPSQEMLEAVAEDGLLVTWDKDYKFSFSQVVGLMAEFASEHGFPPAVPVDQRVKELEGQLSYLDQLQSDYAKKYANETAVRLDWQARAEKAEAELGALKVQKDGAYAERDRLVCALSKLFLASLERHPDSDTTWEDDWRWIVFIDLPTGQATWHIHDSELAWFDHLPRFAGKVWDGHTTPEKYARLAALSASPDTSSSSPRQKPLDEPGEDTGKHNG